MSTNPEMQKALASAANDNGDDTPLTVGQMKFDLVDQGLGDVLQHFMKHYPKMNEAEAITHPHSFY